MYIKFLEINANLNEENIKFLFMLLQKRKFYISHKNMPTWEDHEKFVKSKPYFKWFIILEDKIKIGSLYINHDNSIGLSLIEEKKLLIRNIISIIENKFEPQQAIKSSRPGKFFYNVNPNDEIFIKALKENGYQISQISFVK